MTADPLRPAATDLDLIEAQARLAEARALEAQARTAYAAALAGPDPAAVHAARDRLSGIECAIGRLHGAAALAERRLRATIPQESARA